jgi:hypothetical protein
MDPVTIGLMGADLVAGGINYFRGRKDRAAAEAALGAMGDSPNYTLSSDYDRMVNMALNAPQLGVAAANRAYADQAAMAGAYGSRGLGSLNQAARTNVDALNALGQSRLDQIQGAIGTRAGAAQGVMDANVSRAQSLYDAERERLLAEKAGAQDMMNAGITSAINLGGGLLAGGAGALTSGTTFGQGLEAFYNPSQANLGGGFSFSSVSDDAFRAEMEKRGLAKDGGRIKKLKAGDSIVTDGPEDHDKLEYLIARMVKTKNGTKLEPVATSTGQERHEINGDGEITVTNSKQEKSLQDGYEEGEKTGNWGKAIAAMKRIFSQERFKN